MTLTSHAIISLVISRYVPAPFAAFWASALGHYIADMVPHGDEFIYFRYLKNKKDPIAVGVAVVDVLVLTIACIVFYLGDMTVNGYAFVSAVLGGIFPDILINGHTAARKRFRTSYQGLLAKFELAYHRLLQWHYRWHMFCHYLTKRVIRFRYGLLIQAVVITGSAYVYFNP